MKTSIPSLINFIKNMSDDQVREKFATKCGTTLGYLKLVMYGNRKCSAALAINIDRESKGEITCDVLCPEVDFNYLRNQPISA